MSKPKVKSLPACDPTSLGCLLRDKGLVDSQQLLTALQFQVENADLLLGEALVRLGIISREILEVMLAEQNPRRNGARKSSNLRVQQVLQMATQQTIATGAAGIGLMQALQSLSIKLGKG